MTVRKIPTIDDIAQRANVSRTTVSFVLNDVPVKLHPRTHEKVLEAARELGYYPNSVARALKKRRTNSVALINPNLSDPYFSEFAQLFWSAAQQQGYRTTISYGMEEAGVSIARPDDLYMLIGQRVDGVVLHNVAYPYNTGDIALPMLAKFPLPIVIAGPLTETPPPCPSVLFDLAAGGYLAGQHLLEQSRRRILFVGHIDQRLAGLQHVLAEAGLSTQVIECQAPDELPTAAIRDLFSRTLHPDAIVAGNDIIALRLLGLLQLSGIQVPDDVALLGMGNIALCSMLYPALTSISLRRTEMVDHAISFLTALGRGEEIAQPHIVLQPQLMARASTLGHSIHPTESRFTENG